MTVPTDAEVSTSQELEQAGFQAHDVSRRRRMTRRRGVLLAGLAGVALVAGVLVYAFPFLAVPLGTAVAVVAVGPPLAQWLAGR
ncbi:hypothetical protein HEK131_56340 [Streptomyces seoulensis]|nr:hypothetical protein HEK131_56340 [Streptomyces seoulensis]